MAKINVASKSKVVNKAGGKAFNLDLKNRFVSRLMTCLWNEPNFYGDTTDDFVEDAKAMIKQDPEFVYKAAKYARHVMNLRTAPTVLCGLLALDAGGKKFARKAITEICSRPDQLTELVAYLQSGRDATLAKKIRQVRLGISDAFSQFDEYQLAKYNRDGKVKLRDVLSISHPKPKDQEQSDMWKRLLEDKLETPMTWETQISTRGNKAEVWDELIESKKLPYMASLRNLRNLIQSGATKLNDVLEMIANPEAVKRSKQLPFRFYSAYRELNSSTVTGVMVNKTMKALAQAISASIENLPKIEGRTMISTDNSGSMQTALSAKSVVTYQQVGHLLGVLFSRLTDDCITSAFGTEFVLVKDDGISSPLSMVDKFCSAQTGYSTNGHLVIQHLLDNNIAVDRVVIFSDMQLWNSNPYTNCSLGSVWEQYKEKHPNAWLHLVNLAGYGTTPVCLHDKKVNMLSGWSESILQFIKATEEGAGTMISAIEKY